MKTNLKFLATFIAVTLISLSANAQKRSITIKQLPAPAQSFLTTNFPNQAPAYIEEDKGMISTDYEVKLTGGTEIEFDGKGNWEEVDGNKTAIPTSVLPKTIATYLTANYKGQGVEKIELKKNGYKVELLNDVELEFDTNGKFLRIDD
jgi:hypothetical protein